MIYLISGATAPWSQVVSYYSAYLDQVNFRSDITAARVRWIGFIDLPLCPEI